MTLFRYLGKKAFMPSEIKQALKQLRKALNEQRTHELLLRAGSTLRYDTFVGKLIPLIPVLMGTFASSSNDAPSAQSGQLLLLTKLARSLTDDQVAAIQEHLSIKQKEHLIELLRSVARAPHTASSNTSQETSSSAAQAASHTTETAPVRHWFYPSSVIGCGLNIDDLHAEELSCLRHEVTCSGCLAKLRADQEKNPTQAKADAAASS